MTTPDDAAPIVFERDGLSYLLEVCPQSPRHSTRRAEPADLAAAGFIPASELSAERLARAEVERALEEESATLSAIRRRHDLCGSCDGLNCAHLWPDKKCCPDCDHERPEAAKAAEGEVERKCWCIRCNGDDTFRRMAICPSCSNKRCPRAGWHGFVCTGSNDVGQVGTEPQSPAGEKDSSHEAKEKVTETNKETHRRTTSARGEGCDRMGPDESPPVPDSAQVAAGEKDSKAGGAVAPGGPTETEEPGLASQRSNTADDGGKTPAMASSGSLAGRTPQTQTPAKLGESQVQPEGATARRDEPNFDPAGGGEERVTHDRARELVSLWGADPHGLLLTYMAQQEQSEHEAAELRAELLQHHDERQAVADALGMLAGDPLRLGTDDLKNAAEVVRKERDELDRRLHALRNGDACNCAPEHMADSGACRRAGRQGGQVSRFRQEIGPCVVCRTGVGNHNGPSDCIISLSKALDVSRDNFIERL